jgi:phage N-6-adenine-methyltransferase
MNTAVLFSSSRDDWQTPPEVFGPLSLEFCFAQDVAATAGNSLCPDYIGPDHWDETQRDALSTVWARSLYGSQACWCNPPYSRGLQGRFIAKAAAERRRGVTTVMLIPARTDTRAFHVHVWNSFLHQPHEGVEVRFLPGRIKFVGAKHGAPFPSMVVVFRGER